jgi:Aldo/keto reductase family
VALAWLLRNPVVSAAIVGPRTSEELQSGLGALSVPLDTAVVERLDQIWPGPGGAPAGVRLVARWLLLQGRSDTRQPSVACSGTSDQSRKSWRTAQGFGGWPRGECCECAAGGRMVDGTSTP